MDDCINQKSKISGNPSEACIFCKIVKGDMPCHKIWEDEKHLAFLSIFPNIEGFSVVITKEHLPSYAFDLDDERLSELVIATKKVGKLLDKKLDSVGRTGMFFEGFGVDHAHAKLFPMHGTADMEKWKPIESRKETVYEQYPGFLSSHDAGREDDEKLARLAKKIRGEDD